MKEYEFEKKCQERIAKALEEKEKYDQLMAYHEKKRKRDKKEFRQFRKQMRKERGEKE